MIFYRLPGFCQRTLARVPDGDRVIMDSARIRQLNEYISDTPGTGMTRLGNVRNGKYGKCIKRAVIKKQPDGRGSAENALTEINEGEGVVIKNKKDGYVFIVCEYYSGWVEETAVEPCAALPQKPAGHMPYTVNNLVKTACSYLGTPYGWGGTGGGTDCSGYVRSVYGTFGISLPRDCATQALIPAAKKDMSGMSEDEKRRFIKTLPPGAILQFDGHEMLYLCECAGELYVINAVNTLLEPSNTNVIKHPAAVVINDLSMLRPNKKSWLSELNLAIIIK